MRRCIRALMKRIKYVVCEFSFDMPNFDVPSVRYATGVKYVIRILKVLRPINHLRAT